MFKNQFIVDKDNQYLDMYNWYVASDGYVLAYVHGKHIQLHRLIMNAPDGIQVDHINHNKLDNRISNLRLCTDSENKHNRPLQKNNTSGYKGVHWDNQHKRWKAQLRFNSKRIVIGFYDDPQEAAGAYFTKALDLFGEFAYS